MKYLSPIEHVMDLLAVEGLTGQEQPVADLVRAKLIAAGCKSTWIKQDQAHKKIGKGFSCGNLIVKMPGTKKGPRVLFSAHLDKVPVCRDAIPVLKGNRIVPKHATGLGADNRSGCGALVVMAETLLRDNIPHPPITLLFSVGEEVGLQGARVVDAKDLGYPVMGFNVDGGDPFKMEIGAVGAVRWTATLKGISSHAGVHPEEGASSAIMAAHALQNLASRGLHGRVNKASLKGTANVGMISGGEATNQVMDCLTLVGECRSHNPAMLTRLVGEYRKAFERAARSVKNNKGRAGCVDFTAELAYKAFRIPANASVVKRALQAARAVGGKPSLCVTDGGLDANYYNAKGIPTVTFGAGSHAFHSVDEYLDVKEYLAACKLLVDLAQVHAEQT